MGPWTSIGAGRFVPPPPLASPLTVIGKCPWQQLPGPPGAAVLGPASNVNAGLTALNYRTQLERRRSTDVTTSGTRFLVVGGGVASLRRWQDPNMRRRNTVRDGRRAGGFGGPDDDMRGTRVGLAGLIWLLVMGGVGGG